MLAAYCELLNEQQVYKNVYKFESILHLTAA
jgi:hypothetical protein